jgi:hypothetical protein
VYKGSIGLRRSDVAVLSFVDVVDHRRQSGGLARSGGAGHQHQAARKLRDVLENGRRLQFLQGEHLGRNGPQHHAGAAVLHEGVDPEARQIRDREREVDLQILFVKLALTVVHDVVDHRMHVLVLHRRQVDAPHVAMDANHGRKAGRKMQVGSVVLYAESEEFRDVHL